MAIKEAQDLFYDSKSFSFTFPSLKRKAMVLATFVLLKFFYSCVVYHILSKNLSPKVPREIRHLVAIRIGISKIAQGEEYLDYPGETLERIAKLWNATVIVK